MKIADLEEAGILCCPECHTPGGTHPNGAGFLEDGFHVHPEGWCANCGKDHPHAFYICGLCCAESCPKCGARGRPYPADAGHDLEVHINWQKCWCGERHKESFTICNSCQSAGSN